MSWPKKNCLVVLTNVRWRNNNDPLMEIMARSRREDGEKEVFRRTYDKVNNSTAWISWMVSTTMQISILDFKIYIRILKIHDIDKMYRPDSYFHPAPYRETLHCIHTKFSYIYLWYKSFGKCFWERQDDKLFIPLNTWHNRKVTLLFDGEVILKFSSEF